jgi:hypothetical protein
MLKLYIDREFIDRVYTIHDKEEGKYYVWSEALDEDDVDIEDVFPLDKKHVRGHVYLNAYCFTDLSDGKGAKVVQISQTDIKGSIPRFLVNKFVPSGAIEFIS